MYHSSFMDYPAYTDTHTSPHFDWNTSYEWSSDIVVRRENTTNRKWIERNWNSINETQILIGTRHITKFFGNGNKYLSYCDRKTDKDFVSSIELCPWNSSCKKTSVFDRGANFRLYFSSSTSIIDDGDSAGRFVEINNKSRIVKPGA